MKTNSIKNLGIAIAAVLFAMLTSCQKENSFSETATVTEDQAATYSEESTTVEASFDDVEDISMTAADEENNASVYDVNARFLPEFQELRAAIGDCAEITVSPNDNTYPKTITIDFGAGCLGRDGKFRSGAIVLHFTGPLRRPGSVLTITFRDFYLNRAHIEGSKIISNLSDPPVHKWSVQVVGGKVTFPSGRGYSYEGIKNKKQVEGADTRTLRDDVYVIEGRSQTKFNGGLTITLNTETPLVKKVACRWISDGTVKIKINDRVLYLDYGFPNNGDCDNKALLTWNNGNQQRIILLP